MSYFGLSTEELQKLSEVSGEAVRLYLAVSSYCYGAKTSAYPQWWQLAERMGKPFEKEDPEKRYSKGKKEGQLMSVQVQRQNSKRPLQKLAEQLEKVGLVKRGWNKETNTREGERWTLPFKAQLIAKRESDSDDPAKSLPPPNLDTTPANLNQPSRQNQSGGDDQMNQGPRQNQSALNKKPLILNSNTKFNNENRRQNNKDKDSLFEDWWQMVGQPNVERRRPFERFVEGELIQIRHWMMKFEKKDWKRFNMDFKVILKNLDREMFQFINKLQDELE